MSIKLICIDMDGTLLKNDHEISDIDKSAVQAAIKKGIHVAITTGRVYKSAKLYADSIGLSTPIIASNGAYIGGTHGETIYQNPLSKEEVQAFLQITNKYNLLSYMNTNSGIISATELPDNHIYKLLNKTLKPEDQILLEVIPNIDDVFVKYKKDILKGVCREEVDSERLLKAKAELKKSNPHLEIVSSWHNNFEVMKKGSSKGDAVKALTTFFNLTPEEVMCIGDSENDLSMIKYAGIGVAMGNAIDIIKEQAQYVTADNTKGGVAQAIQKFVLDEPSL